LGKHDSENRTQDESGTEMNGKQETTTGISDVANQDEKKKNPTKHTVGHVLHEKLMYLRSTASIAHLFFLFSLALFEFVNSLLL